MLIFFKNMALFLFGETLNGTIFAERERERERERDFNGRYIVMCRVLACAYFNEIFNNLRFVFTQCEVFVLPSKYRMPMEK